MTAIMQEKTRGRFEAEADGRVESVRAPPTVEISALRA